MSRRINLITGTLLAISLIESSLAAGNDLSQVKSGLLLGIYASPDQGGMRVTKIIPGYSAQTRLLPGDVLMRATIDGATIYQLRSTSEMETAKAAIGANHQAALEIYRPGKGHLYAWVEFTSILSPTAASSLKNRAMFRMESEQPGARDMFQTNSDPEDRRAELSYPGFSLSHQPAQPMPFISDGLVGRSAAELFGK